MSFQQLHIDTPIKTGLNRKSQVDTKLGESFCLPYLGICKSQNVLANIYCNFASLLGLIYPSNMDLFAFLTVIS